MLIYVDETVSLPNPFTTSCLTRYYASIAMALLYDTLVSGKNTNQFQEKNNDEYDICGGSCASQRVHFAIDVVEQASEHYRRGRHCNKG